MRPTRKRETGKAEARHPVGANGAEARRGFVACENEPGHGGNTAEGNRSDFDHIRRRRVIPERFFFPSRSQFGKIVVADEPPLRAGLAAFASPANIAVFRRSRVRRI
jgi:hypothetical protein